MERRTPHETTATPWTLADARALQSRLGEGESRSGGHRRPSILADALEAVIGAVHLDAGYAAAEALVHRLFQSVDITPQMQAAAKDPKTELQEWLPKLVAELKKNPKLADVGSDVE